MTQKKPNLFVRLLRGIWRFVDGTRKLVFNLIFLFVVIVILAIVFRESGTVIQQRSALVVNPMGFVVEQFTSDPFERVIDRLRGEEEPETRFRDMIEAIRWAKTDGRVDRLVLEPDLIWSIGPAQLQELKSVLADFKSSGKSVIAYSEGMGQHQYYLAAMADEIWLHPEGLVLLEGYSVYRNYYKDLLEKLEVNVHLFRVGEYKSAGEPFVRNDMSDESKEANRYWLEGLWEQFLQDVAAARGLTPEALSSDIAEYDDRLRAAGGTPAQMALNQGLVDRIANRSEFNTHLAELGAWDEELQSYRQIGFERYTTVPGRVRPLADKVAVVIAQGPIMYGEQPPGVIGGESTARLIREARADDHVRAIVLRVDSPGGAVLPSEKIRSELEAARSQGLPVVVSMGTVAASGGYWISMSADQIWAEPGTITGSIGIFGLLANIPRTLARIGVHTDGVGTTPLAGAFRIDRELPEQAADIIQQIVEDGYESFITKVAQHRGMAVEEVDRVARGRVWTGAQALDRGLVDQMGGLTDAIGAAAAMAGLDEDHGVDYYEQKPTKFEQWLLSASARLPAGILGGSDLQKMATRLSDDLPEDLALLMEMRSGRPGLFSYCFCGL